MTDGAIPKIRARGIEKRFGDNLVLRGADLDVMSGESLVLIGTSGSGKSLLLKCLLGLQTPDAGSVIVDGVETVGFAGQQRMDFIDQFGVLFQYAGLFDSLPVWENIAFKAIQTNKMERDAARTKAAETLETVGLDRDALDLFPHELSGGMQKRVGIARAIFGAPEILFLDEPTAGLDPIAATEFDKLINYLQDNLDLTIMMITHDVDSLFGTCDRIAVLVDGNAIVGTIDEILEHENEWIQSYFGVPRARRAATTGVRPDRA